MKTWDVASSSRQVRTDLLFYSGRAYFNPRKSYRTSSSVKNLSPKYSFTYSFQKISGCVHLIFFFARFMDLPSTLSLVKKRLFRNIISAKRVESWPRTRKPGHFYNLFVSKLDLVLVLFPFCKRALLHFSIEHTCLSIQLERHLFSQQLPAPWLTRVFSLGHLARIIGSSHDYSHSFSPATKNF